MEFNLQSEKGIRYQINNTAWEKILYLAKRGGWIPHGTLPPVLEESQEKIQKKKNPLELSIFDPRTWGIGYQSNFGQTVTTQDALSMADSLENMLDDLPKKASLEIDSLELENESVQDLNPVDFFGGENKQKVKDVIVFCREGEFIIS